MKCPYCDEEIEAGSAACPICGKSLISNNETEPETTPETGETQEPVVTEAPVVIEESAVVEAGSSDVAAPAGGEKKSNKKVLIIGAVVALAAVVGIGVALMPKKNPKDTVIDAFKSIVAEGQTDPMEDIFGFKAMNEKALKESSEVAFELQLADSSQEAVNQFATGKISMTSKNDVANKKMSFNLGVGFADMNLANLEMYMDEKLLAVSVPELSSKSFTLNYADDLEGQLERSAYVGEMLSDSGIALSGFSSYFTKVNEMASSGKELFNVNELWTRYKDGSKAIDDLKTAMTVENADKKTFTIAGKEESCNGYNVTITKDALIQFITTTKDFFLTDETLKKDFVEYMSLMLELQNTMGSLYYMSESSTPEQYQEETWKTINTEIDNFIAQLKESMSDVTMVVYVTKDNKMASFDYSTTANIENEDIKFYGTVTFGGGYSMMSNVNATLNLEDMTADVMTFTLDKTGTYEAGKTFAGGFTASVTYDADTYSMVTSADYAIDGGAYNMLVDFQSNGKSAGKISSKGLVQNLVKGESFELLMDSIKMESDMITGVNEYIDLSGLYKRAPLSSEIEMAQGESFDILAATEDDWTNVATEIVGNAYGLAMSFY